MAERLFLIDTYGFVFRAYHARARSGAPPMRTSSGLSTEAIYIFHNMMRRLTAAHKPDYMAAIFESQKKTFREEAFTAYKANRTEMPPDLREQLPYIRKILEAQQVPILQYDGFEADDVIGAIASQAAGRGIEVMIVSSDKDMLQLVNDHVRMLNPMKDDFIYDAAAAEEFMGVPPRAVADLLALKGDAIDNIPGAPGIGEKGAKELIVRFGSVEAAIARAAEITKKTQRESLQNNRDQILLSKQLATIDCTVPVEWSLESLRIAEGDKVRLRQLYRELEFFSLLKELGPAGEQAGGDWASLETEEAVREYLAGLSKDQPAAMLLGNPAEGQLAFDAVFGVAHAAQAGRAIPQELFGALQPWLGDAAMPKITHDWKSLLLELTRREIPVAGVVRDLMLESFLLSPDSAAADLGKLSERYLDRTLAGAVERRAACMLELAEFLDQQMAGRPGVQALYREVELPLARVLARMEEIGVCVATSQLASLSGRMDIEVQRLTAEIHELAGHGFNINSPQQLGKVLFEEMGLPVPVKYGKGKQISTAAE
ncbi:MAG: DNA polymerase I, partial [Bryobacterales bacterium]|nr:DNA polymerase I [Bryobacterales bacterium]